MSDKVFTVIALASLIAFLGILPWRVPEPDLIIVVVVVLVIACRDIWSGLRDTQDR